MLRRSFLSRFSAATAAFGLQPPQSSSTSRPRAWEAAHHEQDEWLADNAAKHRIIFDTWNAERVAVSSLQLAQSQFLAIRHGIGMHPSSIRVTSGPRPSAELASAG